MFPAPSAGVTCFSQNGQTSNKTTTSTDGPPDVRLPYRRFSSGRESTAPEIPASTYSSCDFPSPGVWQYSFQFPCLHAWVLSRAGCADSGVNSATASFRSSSPPFPWYAGKGDFDCVGASFNLQTRRLSDSSLSQLLDGQTLKLSHRLMFSSRVVSNRRRNR